MSAVFNEGSPELLCRRRWGWAMWPGVMTELLDLTEPLAADRVSSCAGLELPGWCPVASEFITAGENTGVVAGVLIWPLRGWLLWGNGPKPDSNLTRPALLFLVFCSLSGSNGRSLRSKWYRFLAKTLISIFIVFWTKINSPIKNRSLYMLNSINYLPPILESILPKLSVLIELKQTDPRDPPWLQHSDLLVSK